MVWSDAATHPIGYGSEYPGYPKNMAKSFDELTCWWGDRQNRGFVDQNAKRLILFAPIDTYWSTVSDSWDNVIHYQSVAGRGMAEFDYSQIIDSISNTI